MLTKEINENLDAILAVCCHRLSRHFNESEWEDVTKLVAGSDGDNPKFIAYINHLLEERYIIEAPENGKYIATIRGLDFKGAGSYKGHEADRVSDVLQQVSLNTLERRLKETTKAQNYWLIGIGLVAATYYLIEILFFLHHYQEQIGYLALKLFH